MKQLRMIALGGNLVRRIEMGLSVLHLSDRVIRAGLSESNIVLIHTFKDYCAILFFKGALLNDAEGILIQQTKNVQAARQVRFTNVREIVKLKAILKAYIHEAIEVEKAGLKVNFKKATEYKVPEEFQKKLDKMRCFKNCF